MNKNVFLDTSYAVAISVRADERHERAVELAIQIETEKVNIFTTRAILLEIGNALSSKKHREAAVGLLEHLENDSSITIVSLTDELYRRAFTLFQDRPDKEWGLVDCVSFAVMQEFNRSPNSRQTFYSSRF